MIIYLDGETALMLNLQLNRRKTVIQKLAHSIFSHCIILQLEQNYFFWSSFVCNRAASCLTERS